MGSIRGVVVGVLWKNAGRTSIFVDTWGIESSVLIGIRKGKGWNGRLMVLTHYLLLEL